MSPKVKLPMLIIASSIMFGCGAWQFYQNRFWLGVLDFALILIIYVPMFRDTFRALKRLR